MNQGIRLAASQQRERSPLRRQSWKQAGRKVDSIHTCGREVCRCPRAHLQIESVHVTWGACQQDKNQVPCAIQYDCGRLWCSYLSEQLQWRNKVACNAGACDLKKYATIDYHCGFQSIVKNELEFVEKRPLNGFGATLVPEPLHHIS